MIIKEQSLGSPELKCSNITLIRKQKSLKTVPVVCFLLQENKILASD